MAAVTAETIADLYRGLLGRAPAEAELAHHLALPPSLATMIATIVASAEFAGRFPPAEPQTGPQVPNHWTPEVAPHGLPPGAVSGDGVAEVGRDGMLFLREGSNDVRAQFAGTYPLAGDWAARWSEAFAHRQRSAAALGVRALTVVVPEKLVVEAELVADPPAPGTRPLQRLPGPVLYPLAELRALPGRAHLRTDTHLTLEGSHALSARVLAELGAPPPPAVETIPIQPVFTAGDLGSRFHPPQCEVMRKAAAWPGTLLEDNWPEMLAAGRHAGTRTVIANDAAPDARTCVVFGDSCSFGRLGAEGLTFWLAHAFRRVHFLWRAFGWDSRYLEEVRADVAISEGAERFAVRPPSPEE